MPQVLFPITIIKSETVCRIKGSLQRYIFDALRKKLSYLPDDYQFRTGPAWVTGICKKCGTKNKKNALNCNSCSAPLRDPNIYFYSHSQFPTGLLDYALEVFDHYNQPYKIEQSTFDNVEDPIVFIRPDFNINENYILRDYQEESIQVALNKHRGLIQAPTGAGKSLMAAHFIERVGLFPALVCLRSKDLLGQTVELYQDYLGVPIGKITEGKYDIKAITIAMDQTINSGMRSNNPELLRYLKSIKTLVVDECHHQVAKTVQKMAYTCKSAEYRIGYSGTPVRDLNDDMEIEAALGPIIHKTGISDLIDKGYLVPPRIFMLHMPLMDVSNKPYPMYPDIIADYIENNPTRDKYIAQCVEALLEEDKLVLILVNRIEHGENIEKLIKGAIFVHGSTELCMRNLYFQQFKERKRKVIIASSIIDEGWDCPPLDALILAHPYKSLVKCYQRLGRALRTCEGKEDAIIVDFFDHVKYLEDHSIKRMKLYQLESRFEITEGQL